MKIIIDTFDLSKYDKKMDDILDIMIQDFLAMVKERKEKFGISDAFAVSQLRYSLLKASIVLSQSLERKIMNLIEDADGAALKGFFKDVGSEKK